MNRGSISHDFSQRWLDDAGLNVLGAYPECGAASDTHHDLVFGDFDQFDAARIGVEQRVEHVVDESLHRFAHRPSLRNCLRACKPRQESADCASVSYTSERSVRTTKLTVTALLGIAAVACSAAEKPPAPPAPAIVPESEASMPDHPSAAAPQIDWSRFESTSLRNPNDGSLEGGVPLPLSSPGLRFNPKRDPKARHGTLEVVRALVRAAARVDQELGGLPVIINDLSYERGGPLPHHRSHQSGRDVDVFFYQLGPDGRPISSVGAFFDPEGRGVDFRNLADPSDDVSLSIDLPRTWLFLQSLIEDEQARLQHIYVAEHLRALLLEHARSLEIDRRIVARFEDMTCQPAYPHDDHFHFRFFCSPQDVLRGCNDSPPLYPWHLEELTALGITPRPLEPKRPHARAKIVTHEEARRAAGPMDEEVQRWLDRREQWIEKPHPGRPYCP